MWIRKKITLLSDPQLAESLVLTREAVAEHQQALTVMQLAERQAQQRLEQANREAEQLLAEAQLRIGEALKTQAEQQQHDFAQQAQQLFTQWQEQEQQWQQALIPRAEALLSQAMIELLDQQPEAARLQATLAQLLKAQGRQAAATLICAPAYLPVVEAWLAERPQLVWEISADAALAPDQLILTTGQGELHLSWSRICETLLPTH